MLEAFWCSMMLICIGWCLKSSEIVWWYSVYHGSLNCDVNCGRCCDPSLVLRRTFFIFVHTQIKNIILYKFRTLYIFYYFQLLYIIQLGCEESFSNQLFLWKTCYLYFQMCLYMGLYLLLETLQCIKNCWGWVNPSFRHWNSVSILKWDYSGKSHLMAWRWFLFTMLLMIS